eukprot:COSAG06_NODE_39177_length_415_cov_1.199367_1_plen_25_part_10
MQHDDVRRLIFLSLRPFLATLPSTA